ncbi:MAG: hypothetical protein ACKVZH_06640 [Blastocatellia bacterium]
MISLTLKQLNDSYQSLNTAADSLTAGKMKYRFARVLKSAKDEVELLGKTLAELAEKHGAEILGGNRFQFDSEKQREELKAFNKEADDMMRTESVELWGDPEFFTFDELEKASDPKKPISAATLADLLFLISDKEPTDATT